MQALKLDAVSGWRWVVAGWRLFRKQPFSFVALLFLSWLLLLCASAIVGWFAQGLGTLLPFLSVDLIATVGSFLVAMMTPALAVGFMQACRIADSGLRVHPVLLLAPFRAGKTTLLRLLMLGLIQMAALMLILSLTTGTAAFRSEPAPEQTTVTAPATKTPAAGGTVATTPAGGLPDRPTDAEQEEKRREAVGRIVQGLAYIPVALLMWYAPPLVAWHAMAPGKALFFSLVAVWRNRSVFAVYGLAWLAIWIAVSIAIGIVAALIGFGGLAALVAAPLVMLMLTCMYCSVYPTYATVFVDPDAPVPQPVATST